MNRGDWWATVHEVTRGGNDLATKQQQEEARDAAKHLMMHRTTPKSEELSSLNCQQYRRSNLEY